MALDSFLPTSLLVNEWFVVGAANGLAAVNSGTHTSTDSSYVVGFTKLNVIGSIIAWGFTIPSPGTWSGWQLWIRVRRPQNPAPQLPMQVVLYNFNTAVWVNIPLPTFYGFNEFKTSVISIDEAAIASFNGDFTNFRIALVTNPNHPNLAEIDISEIEMKVPEPVAPIRITQGGLEILSHWDLSPIGIVSFLSKVGLEVLASHPIPRITQAGIEILGKYIPSNTHITKLGVEVLIKTGNVNITKLGVEVLSKPGKVNVTKCGVEILAKNPIWTNAIHITKTRVEVLSKYNPSIFTSYITQCGIEVLSKWSPPVVIPLSYSYIPARIFHPYWNDKVIVETIWNTTIFTSQSTGYEQRLQNLERSYRTIQVSFLALNREDISLLTAYLRDISTKAIPVPIFSDYTKISADAFTHDFLVFCDTEYRRFHQGQRIVIYLFDSKSRPDKIGFYIIKSVTSGYIELTTELEADYPVGSRIMPMVDAEINYQLSYDLITNRISKVTLTIIEKIGENTLLVYDKHSFNKYEDFYVWEFTYNWNDTPRLGISQLGSVEQLGLGTTSYTVQDRPDDVISGTVSCLSKAKSFEYLSFFNKHQGRTVPFWFMLPFDVFELVELQPTYIRVKTKTKEYDFSDYLLGFKLHSGTVLIRRFVTVQEVIEGVFEFTLLFGEDLDIAIDDVKMIGLATLVRYTSDSCRQEFITDSIIDIPFEVIRKQEPKSIEFENLE